MLEGLKMRENRRLPRRIDQLNARLVAVARAVYELEDYWDATTPLKKKGKPTNEEQTPELDKAEMRAVTIFCNLVQPKIDEMFSMGRLMKRYNVTTSVMTAIMDELIDRRR